MFCYLPGRVFLACCHLYIFYISSHLLSPYYRIRYISPHLIVVLRTIFTTLVLHSASPLLVLFSYYYHSSLSSLFSLWYIHTYTHSLTWLDRILGLPDFTLRLSPSFHGLKDLPSSWFYRFCCRVVLYCSINTLVTQMQKLTL